MEIKMKKRDPICGRLSLEIPLAVIFVTTYWAAMDDRVHWYLIGEYVALGFLPGIVAGIVAIFRRERPLGLSILGIILGIVFLLLSAAQPVVR